MGTRRNCHWSAVDAVSKANCQKFQGIIEISTASCVPQHSGGASSKAAMDTTCVDAKGEGSFACQRSVGKGFAPLKLYKRAGDQVLLFEIFPTVPPFLHCVVGISSGDLIGVD